MAGSFSGQGDPLEKVPLTIRQAVHNCAVSCSRLEAGAKDPDHTMLTAGKPFWRPSECVSCVILLLPVWLPPGGHCAYPTGKPPPDPLPGLGSSLRIPLAISSASLPLVAEIPILPGAITDVSSTSTVTCSSAAASTMSLRT